MGILLFFVALIPTVIFVPLGMLVSTIYYFFTAKWKSGIKAINSYFYNMALSIDQFANTNLYTLLNLIMVKGDGYYPFGDADDTLSYCIAENQKRELLTRFGKFWAWFLDKVDPGNGGHMKKTLIAKEQRDYEAYLRHKERLEKDSFENESLTGKI